MQIAVWATDEQWKEIISCSTSVEWKRMDAANDWMADADAIFILQESNVVNLSAYTKPIFLHAVDSTLKEINAPVNVIRINGWTNFLQSQHWEIAGEINEDVKQLLATLNKQFTPVPDEPGFVAARIISMIINEAYFALGQEVSTKNEIDIAMKLGTNYPYGPFEWAGIIGIKNIYALLKKLSTADKRYLPAPLLQKEATT